MNGFYLIVMYDDDKAIILEITKDYDAINQMFEILNKVYKDRFFHRLFCLENGLIINLEENQPSILDIKLEFIQ